MPLMQRIEQRMNDLVKGICTAHGASGTVDFRTIFHPVVNDPAASELAAEVCDELVGVENVIRDGAPGTGSEDFSFMAEQVPGCYLNLGNGEDSHPLHNHDYDFNDGALVYGASFFARIVEKSLQAEP
jgi:hippurate hydrolase